MVTLTVAALDVQLFNVALTLYTPLIGVVVLGRVTLPPVKLNPTGPLQLKVTPAVALVADKLKAVPLQIGLLLVATGIAGGVGSDNVIGPATVLEIQPFNVTVILVYVPAVNPEMIILPPLAVIVCAACAMPPFTKFTT